MPDISISVTNKIPAVHGEPVIICGNSDYNLTFSFDSEWYEYTEKTARFAYWKNGQTMHQDKIFSGNVCPVPVLSGITQVIVGVFAGDLHTTAPASILCETSILCGAGVPEDPPEDVYNQIMELIQGLGEPAPEAIAAAVAEYIVANPITEKDPTVPEWAKAEKKPSYTADEVGAIAETELQNAIDTALAQAKASGEFDGAPGEPGAPGKSAYQYAKDGGYTGTDAEFAAKLSEETYSKSEIDAIMGSYINDIDVLLGGEG